MKICLECAEGGHLDEMLNIVPAFKDHRIFFVTTRALTTEGLSEIAPVYYVRDQYNAKHKATIYFMESLYMLKLIVSCSLILLKERPRLIVSTSGGSTIPLCYIGKLLGAKILYIESLARINKPSGTSRFIYPIADVFLVQWESMMKFYPKAKYWGRVI